MNIFRKIFYRLKLIKRYGKNHRYYKITELEKLKPFKGSFYKECDPQLKGAPRVVTFSKYTQIEKPDDKTNN